MSTFTARINKALREAGDVTHADLARVCGISSASVSNWFTGETKSLKGPNLLAAASLLRVSPHWLAEGRGPMRVGTPGQTPQPIDLDGNPDYPAIRRVRFKLSAGASGFGVEYLDEQGAPIVFQRQWYEQRGFAPDKLFAVKVANGSMEPGLFDGDTVVVNTAQSEPRDGVVFAVNYEGELVIKRLVRDAGQWWLCSDNPDQRRYPRKVCHEGTHILGEIVHKQSERL